MEDILLAIALLAFFAFGFFAVSRFGKHIDEKYREYKEPQTPESEEYDIVICREVDSRIIEYLEESGLRIRYDLRQ